MRAVMPVRRAGALGLAGILTMLGLSAGPAGLGSARAAVTPGRFNVGATHSPRLLGQLAGPAGARRPAGPPVIAGAVQGVDVAAFQHPAGAAINWAQAAAGGIRFAAVKATEGAYYRNPDALTDLAQARAAGLSVVAYAFAIPDGNGGSTSAAVQADYLLSYLGGDARTVPIMLDIEYDPYVSSDKTNQCYGLTPAAMVSWVAAFDAEVQRKTGRLPVVYAPIPWWSTCTGGSAAFGQLPLWVPDYTTAASPGLPAGWGNWSIWQYTSSGTVPGINATGATDLDQLNPGLLAVLDPGGQRTVAGSPADWPLKPAVPVAGQVPSFSARGLPAGVSVSAAGLVTGWPDRPGTYPVQVTAAGGRAAGSVSFTWTVQPAPDTGPAGLVHLQRGGKCLRDAGNRTRNGNPVGIWSCTASAAQRWTVAQDDTIRIHGKCLAISGSGTAGGTPVDLTACTGSAAQQWRPGTRGRLVNPASGKCLADPAGSTKNGTQVQLRSCTGKASQQWTLPAGPVVSQVPGQCLDDRGNAGASGTPVDLTACSAAAAQVWQALPGGTIQIHGGCLAVARSGSVSGTLVDLSACTGSRTQQWHLTADGAGVSLVNPASGLCLADPADATASGTRLKMLTCRAADPGMAWRVR